jgi:hypothetical protein
VVDGYECLEVVFPRPYAPQTVWCSDLIRKDQMLHVHVLDPDNLQDAAIIAGFLLLHSEFVASVQHAKAVGIEADRYYAGTHVL